MSGVAKTNKNVTANYNPANKTLIYINRLKDATFRYNTWTNKHLVYWSKYQIKETDMRVKTATFTSDTYLDLTTGVYCVLITSPYHEDFGGVILSVEKDNETGLYNYQCQDFTRQYQTKWELVLNGVKLHRLIQYLISSGEVGFTGDTKKAVKSWKNELSGLKPAYQYEQKYWGSIVNFNPMTAPIYSVIKGKSAIEIIRDSVFGTGAYIDVYTNKYGVLQIEPFHKDEWLNSCVEIPFAEIQDMKVSFDTTNIITGVEVQNKDQLDVGKSYSSKKLIGLDLAAIFGNNGASISDPNQTQNVGKTKTTTKKNTSTKNAKKINSNPYNTKKKQIFLNSDNIYGRSADKQFLNDIANKLKKQGWKTKIIGVGPNTHTESYARKYKNGVWFCVYGGADGAVFRECAKKNSYTNTLKKNNLRTVIGMRAGCDIRKGGKCYKYLKRAHDDNYSPSGYHGISYPLKMLTNAKVPIMYASTADKMVAKFLKGGDNPKAC